MANCQMPLDRINVGQSVAPGDAILGSKVPGAPIWTLNLALQHTAALRNSMRLVSRLDYEHREGPNPVQLFGSDLDGRAGRSGSRQAEGE